MSRCRSCLAKLEPGQSCYFCKNPNAGKGFRKARRFGERPRVRPGPKPQPLPLPEVLRVYCPDHRKVEVATVLAGGPVVPYPNARQVRVRMECELVRTVVTSLGKVGA